MADDTMEMVKKFSIGLVIVGLTLVIGLKITSDTTNAMTVDKTVDNETFNATSVPYTFTVDEQSTSNFNELVTVTCYDTVNQNSEISCEVQDADDGKVNVTGGTVDSEKESISYDYHDDDTQAQQGGNDAVSGLQELSSFVPIIGLVVAAVVVIGLLTRGLGGSGRRGRA